MKRYPKVIIEQDPRGWFKIYRLESKWFGLKQEYDYVETAYDIETAEKIAQIVIHPIVKEYYEEV